MSFRFSRFTTGMFVLAALALMSGVSWAVYHGLGPSKDDWGMKFDVQIVPDEGDKLTVVFTVADEGRLKPFDSATLVAFSKQTDRYGGRSYDVKEPIKLKAAADGKHVGQAKLPKEHADRAMIRILTLTVDGKRQTKGAAFYDIPLKKYLASTESVASPSVPRKLKVKR